MSGLIVIGKVGRPYGLRGAFFVSGREGVVPKAYDQILLGSSPPQITRIKSSFLQSGKPVLHLDIVTDRSQAQTLGGLDLYVDPKQLDMVREKDTFFYADIMAADVVDASGKTLGKVDSIYENGPQSIAVILDTKDTKRSCLDIPLVGSYIDFSSTRPGCLKLIVNGEIFDECWYVCGTTP